MGQLLADSLEGLSRLRVHKLHLHAGRHAAPVAPLGLHLVLNGADLEQDKSQELKASATKRFLSPCFGYFFIGKSIKIDF